MIGIFGGTFDPVHFGHLRAALEVKEIFGLDEIRLILSAQPPHRPAPRALIENRLDMLTLAVQDEPTLIIDMREIERAGASYMVMTLESLRQEYLDQSLLLFMGIDAFNKLNTWYQWQQLFEFAHIVVLTRPNYVVEPLDDFYTDKMTNQLDDLVKQLSGKLYFQAITQLDISATAIRTQVATGKSPRFLLPDPVLSYIKKHQLYTH